MRNDIISTLAMVTAVILVAMVAFAPSRFSAAQTTEKVIFEDADGKRLDNWTGYVPAFVLVDKVSLEGYLTLTCDLEATAGPVRIGTRVLWPDRRAWSPEIMLVDGRQTVTVILADFDYQLATTVGVYFDTDRDITLYSATLHVEQSPDDPPEDDDPPTGDEEFDIVWSPAQMKHFNQWLRSTQGIEVDPGTVIKYTWTDLTAESPVQRKRGILRFE